MGHTVGPRPAYTAPKTPPIYAPQNRKRRVLTPRDAKGDTISGAPARARGHRGAETMSAWLSGGCTGSQRLHMRAGSTGQTNLMYV